MHVLLPFVLRLHSGNYTDTNFNRYSDVTNLEAVLAQKMVKAWLLRYPVQSTQHPVAELPALVYWLLPDFHWRHEIISNMFDIYKSRLWRLRIDLEQQNNNFHAKYLRSLSKMNHLWPGLGSGHTPRGWRGGNLGKSSQLVWPAYETS